MGNDTLIFHELFNTLVFQFRVCSVEYFMDSMTEWEINDIVENLPYLDRNLWETCRLNTYMTVRVNTTEKITMQDICKFKWEDTKQEEHITEISDDDIQRLKEKAKHIRLC